MVGYSYISFLFVTLLTLDYAPFLLSGAKVECPTGWTEYRSSCYRFSRSPRKNRIEADAFCREQGSYLVSVNSIEENLFIINWLKEKDPQHIRWHTSGAEQASNTWKWEGDLLPFPNIKNLWLTSDPRFTLNFKYAAYNFSWYENRWGLLRVHNQELGGYICEMPKSALQGSALEERTIDYGVTVTERRKIPRGPTFVKQPTNVVFDLSGRSRQNYVTLRCVATGWPTPTYQWFKEDHEAPDEGKPIDPLSDPVYTQTDGTLLINDPKQPRDRGKYYCKASNEFGTIVSETVQLSFGYVAEFNSHRSTEHGRANWGKAISCDPPMHHPKVNYYWNKNALFSLVEEDRRVFVSHDGNLYFSSVEPIDDANYSCNVQSVISTTGRTGPFFRLKVEAHANNQKLMFPNNFPKAFPEAPLAGELVRLECVAYGYPVPSYNWSRSGITNRLPDGAYTTSHNRVLIIPKAKVEDMGEYACEATSGMDVIKKAVTLSIQALPIFTVPLVDRIMDMGQRLTWVCEAFGIPDVRYSWYKNGRELKINELSISDASRYNIQQNILTIENVIPDVDNGMYQCKAANQLGSKFSGAQLKVLNLKPSFKKHPLFAEMYASISSNFTIACDPEAVPYPEISWRRNGNPISALGSRIRMLPNGYLYIHSVDKADEGEYVCIARNAHGTAETGGYLTVFENPHIVEYPRPKVVATVNDTAELRCEAHSNNELDIAYVWLHNGLPLHYIRMPQFSEGKRIGYLRITNITLAEAGKYTCLVKTSVGKLATETELIVNGPPGATGAVLAEDLTSHSAKISWFDGAENGRKIFAYVIQGRTNHNSTWLTVGDEYVTRYGVDTVTSRRFSTVERLSPWSTYEFRVAAVNELGLGTFSDPSPQYNTDKDKPYKWPKNLGGGGGSTGTLTVTWDPLPPQDWNAPTVWYKVYYKAADTDADFTEVDLKTQGNIGKYAITVGEDNYYKKYLVKIRAVNPVGEGPDSPIAEAYSAEGMPQIQPSLVDGLAYNSTAINVSWARIEATREKVRGKLIGHRIKYWINGRNPEKDSLTLLSRNKEPWGMIVALQPDTEYYISVMAYNEAGSGPESEPIIIRTYKSAPQKAPPTVEVQALDAHTALVKWRGVTEVSAQEEPILGYKVRYWEAEQPLTTAKEVYKYLDGEDLEAIISGLSPGKTYNLRVLAYSKGGDGKMSSPVKTFTIEA